jgi:hypothetical protein
VTTRRYFALTLLLFTALTAAMTFPQALHMRDAVHDDGDPLLNAWTLAWVAHQLPRAPARLFDANIFFPERWTLAFSETLLVPGLFAAPLRWLGAGPVLVHNIVLLSGFALSGAGTALLVRLLTGCGGAGVVAGLVFAFLPYRIAHFPHLQLQQTQCLPFALWAFHRLLSTGRVRDGVLMGIFTAGQVLSCVYYGLFLVPYMGIVCVVTLLFRHRGEARTTNDERWLVPTSMIYRGLLLAAAITVTATAPLARAYLAARAVVGERAAAEVAYGSASWRDYTIAPAVNLLYGGTSSRIAEPEHALFPGFVAVALALLALTPFGSPDVTRSLGTGRASPTRAAYALGLILALDVSLGFNGLTYGMLYDYVVPFRSLRIPARMGIMVGFSLAVLAGYGVASITARVSAVAARRAIRAATGALILLEYASRPIPLQPIPAAIPEVYADLLRDAGSVSPAPLVEYPMSARDDPTYMYYSTFHWEPLVNGYSGFFPASYTEVVTAARDFPGDAFVDLIKRRGARYLAVHQERMIGTRYVRMIPGLDRRSDLHLVSRRPGERYGQHGEISLYRIN